MPTRSLFGSLSAPRLSFSWTVWLIPGTVCLLLGPASAQPIGGPTTKIEQGAENLRHRSAISYPQTAVRNRVQGRVMLVAALDDQGSVYDAQAISGPNELRAAALESVLNWHYVKSPGSSARVSITIHFQLPIESSGSSDRTLLPDYDKQIGVLEQIDASALAESERETLLGRLPVRVQDRITLRLVDQTAEVVREFDSHLRAAWRPWEPDQDGEKTVTLVILYSGQTFNADGQATPTRIRVGERVTARRLVSSVPPVYPQAAKDKGIQETVRLRAVVGKDGAVKELNVLAGPAELAPAALEAVKQWRYSVTQLNGQPVEVETEVSVRFSLSATGPDQ